MSLDMSTRQGRAGQAQAVSLRRQHLHQRVAPAHQFPERNLPGARRFGQLRVYGFGEVSQHAGVDTLCLGEVAGGLGEVVCLAGVDEGRGKPRGQQGKERLLLVAPTINAGASPL